MGKPETVVNGVFERCKDFAQTVFETYGEPEAILFTVVWSEGQNDFPSGTMISRSGMDSNLIMLLIKQLCKQEQKLIATVLDRLAEMQKQIVALKSDDSAAAKSEN